MLPVSWIARAVPLEPEAALALDEQACALAERLLLLPEERLERLRGVAGDAHLVVLGKAEDLPWCEGIRYFGREPESPEMLAPCSEEPDAPVSLLARALRLRFGEALQHSYVVCSEPPLVLPVPGARALTRSLVSAWLDQRQQGSPA